MSIVKSVDGYKTIYSLNEEIVLESESSLEDRKLCIKISGAIKTLVAPCFEEIIQNALSSAEYIVIDFSEISYIASAGLRVLLNMQQEIDDLEEKTVEIIRITQTVRDVLESTGFISILNVIE